MEPLPMVSPDCSLDVTALDAQIDRYRAAGAGAVTVERSRRRIVIRVRDTVPNTVVEELISVESSCCPFFELAWKPEERRLSISVSSSEHGPALDAIAAALGFDHQAREMSGLGVKPGEAPLASRWRWTFHPVPATQQLDP